jgi:hypothetical protein
VPSSRLAHLSKLSSTLCKYGFEGCGVLTTGTEGLRAAFVGDTEGVEHPAISPASTISSSSDAGRTGRGKAPSVVSARLARPLQPLSFSVRRSGGSCEFQSFQLATIVAPLSVSDSDQYHQRQHGSDAQSQADTDHASLPGFLCTRGCGTGWAGTANQPSEPQ